MIYDYETYLKVHKIPFVVLYEDGDLEGRQHMVPLGKGMQFVYERVRTLTREEADTEEGKKLKSFVDLTDLKGRERHRAKNKFKLQKYHREYYNLKQKQMNTQVEDDSP